jgi:murein DD-endopeptidase MepM/ murein hydrolase activator NlpD
VCIAVLVAPAAHAQTLGSSSDVVFYRPPVAAPVIDGFRPPAHVGGAGNRGLEFATLPGSVVRAAAPGLVTFAGRVGRGLHVTVAHPDGVRTSYSFLRTVSVGEGERVTSGQALGTSGTTFHFGARIGSAYVDPAVLLGSAPRARLVPVARFGAGRAARRSPSSRSPASGPAHPAREWTAAAGR